MGKKQVNHGNRTVLALRRDPRFTLVDSVEKYVSFPPPGHRVDLWGIIDIIAIGPGITLAVQATSVGALSAHKKKLTLAPASRQVLEAGWLLEIWAWEKKANRWTCRVHRFELDQPQQEAEDDG